MPVNKQILLVTGATGFVGRAFVERILQEKRFKLRCLVRPGSDTSSLADSAEDVELVVGDITEPETLTAACEGVWGVVNLAGYREFWSRDRKQYYDLNTSGAANVFNAALKAGAEKVVQVSTPLAYGRPGETPFNESTPAGEHPSEYGRSKYMGDNAGWQLHKEHGLPLSVVYLAAVIGAGDDKSTMEVRRAVERRLPALVGADTTYTYLYVKDAAEAIARALLKEDSVGRAYLIGNQRATTRDYFTMIGELADVPIPSLNIPVFCLIAVSRVMEWIARRTGKRPELPLDILKTTAAGSLLFDSVRSVEELDMRYTPLRTALSEAVTDIRAA